MSMSKSSYTYNRVTWEDSEFPILCQTCLGDNPYLRMMKEKYGKECKICARPFTTFRWCPGRGMRYKKTELCQTCAKLKNVCQTCLLDLEYGLPVQVRDYALQLKDDIPKQGANRDFYIQNIEREMAQSDGTRPAGTLGKLADQGPNEMLLKLARTQPYYERNRPHICSFWVKGECKRGEECPYRHEKPTDPDDPLSDQNMKDRYYGANDPVADKLLNRAKAMPVLKPPEDRTVTTLYVGNLGEDGYIVEKDLRNYFYQFGELRSISVLNGKGCAFVQYTSRQAAEMAAEKSFNKLVLKGRRATIRWGRPQSQAAAGTPGGAVLPLVPGLAAALPLPTVDFFNLGGVKRAAAAASSSGEPAEKQANLAASSSSAPVGITQLVPRMPSLLGAGVGTLIVPKVPFINPIPIAAPILPAASSSTSMLADIHYPSQDPQHLGSKDIAK